MTHFLLLFSLLLGLVRSDGPIRFLGLKKEMNRLFPDYPHLAKSYKNDYFGTYPAVQPPPMPIPFPVPVPVADEDPSHEPSYEAPTPNYPPPSSGPKYRTEEVVITTEAEFRCPADFLMQENRCVKFDRKESKLGCKRGWTYDAGVCTGVELAPVSHACGKEYTFDKHKKLCIKGITAPMQVLCPKDYFLGDQDCYRLTHTSPDVACPTDMREEGSACVGERRAQASSVCPPGYLLRGDTCRNVTEAAGYPVCAQGFQLDGGGGCSKLIFDSPKHLCPLGFLVQDNQCVKKKTASSHCLCPKGSEISNGDCVSYREVAGHQGCEGHSEKGGCYREVFAEPSCGKKKCHGKKKLGHGLSEMLNCPFSFNLTPDGSCYKKEILVPKLDCPPGASYDHLKKTCFVEVRSPAEQECPPNFHLLPGTHTCQSLEIVRLEQTCESGFELNMATNVCESLLREEPHTECEQGFTPSGQGSCTKVEVFRPEYDCPAGFDRDHRTGQCISVFTEPLLYSCPAPFEMREAQFDAPTPICVGKEVAEPKYDCPPNFSLAEDGKCINYLSDDIREVCPVGFELRGENCVKRLNEKPVVLCPVGYKLFEQVCINQLFSDPKPHCPDGYQYDALVGKCYKIDLRTSFLNEGVLDTQDPPAPQEALLDLTEPATTTTTTTTPPPREQLLDQFPMQTQPQPQQIQIIQQRIPIPSPVVYLPRQAPPPPPPMPMPPRPMPYPVPVPYSVPKPIKVIKEVPVPIGVPKHLHHSHVVAAQPTHEKKIKKFNKMLH